MKIKSDNFVDYIQNNNNVNNIILLYGPNYGLVDLLYKETISTLSIDINDPFNVSKIDGNEFKDNPSIVCDNITTYTIKFDKRIILLNLTNLTIPKFLENNLLDTLKDNNNDNYLLIIKANNLGTKNELVKYVDNLKNGISTPCYDEDNNNIKKTISKLFSEYELQFSNNFVSILSSKFSNDSSVNLMEIEKLNAFLINNKNTNENMILSLITDNFDQNLNKIVNFCISGNVSKSLFYLDKAYENLNTSIILVRSFVKHFRLIDRILLTVESGSNISEAINNIKPPIFFKEKPILNHQCTLWSQKKIDLIFKRLIDVELKCKSNDFPDKPLISQFILSTSFMARKGIKT